jgi:hypothetical protein
MARGPTPPAWGCRLSIGLRRRSDGLGSASGFIGTVSLPLIGAAVSKWVLKVVRLSLSLIGWGLTTSVNAKLRPTCHWPNCRRQ